MAVVAPAIGYKIGYKSNRRFTDDHTIRAIKLTIIGALECARVRINFTGSMPFGVYTLAPLQHENMERDMLVAVCALGRAATLGLRRGYLARGPCGSGTELLLKSVAAVAGDKVDVTVAGVAVVRAPGYAPEPSAG